MCIMGAESSLYMFGLNKHTVKDLMDGEMTTEAEVVSCDRG